MSHRSIKIPNIQRSQFSQSDSSSKQQQEQQSTPLSPRLGPTRSSIEAKRRERERERERKWSDEAMERVPSTSPKLQTSKSALSYRYGSPDDFPEITEAEHEYSGTFGRSQASLLSSNSPRMSPQNRSTPTLQSTLNLAQPSSRPGSGGGVGEDREFSRSEKSKGKARQIDVETSPTISRKPLTTEDQQLLLDSDAALAYSEKADLADQPRKLEEGEPVSSLDPRAHWLGGVESPPRKGAEIRKRKSTEEDQFPTGRHVHEVSAESQRTFGEGIGIESSSLRPRSRDSLPRIQTQAQSTDKTQDEEITPSNTQTSMDQTPTSSEAPSDNHHIPSTPPRTLQPSSSQERNLNPISNIQYNRNGSRQVSSQAPTISSTQVSPARTRTGVGERGGLSEMGGVLQRTLSPDQEEERLNAIRRKEEVEFERRRNADFNLYRSDTWREGEGEGKSKVGIESQVVAAKGIGKENPKAKKGKRRLFGLKRSTSDATSDRTTSNLTARPNQDPVSFPRSPTASQQSQYLSPPLVPLQIPTTSRVASPSSPMSSGHQSRSPTPTPPKRFSSLYSTPADFTSITRSRSQSEPLEPEPALLEKSRQRLSFVNIPSGSYKGPTGESQQRIRPSSISFPATFSPSTSGGIASEAAFRRLERASSTSNATPTRDLADEIPLGSGIGRGTRRSGSRGRGISTPRRISQNASDLYASPFLSGGTLPSSNQLTTGTDNQTGEVDEAFGLGLGLPIRYSFPISEDLYSTPNLADGRPSLSTLLAHRTRSLARFHLSSLSSLRPRFPANANKVLKPVRFKNSWFARIHHLFLPFIVFYHVPATIFLDYNALYTLTQLAIYGTAGEGTNDSQVGWYVALAVYAASTLVWFFGIVIGVEGIRFLTRSWSKARPYVLPIYLSSNAFNLAAIKSYSLYSFLYKVRMRATPRDRWIETCWFWSQNWPTVATLLPRGIISVTILVLYGPSASDVVVVDSRDSTYFDSEDGYLTNFIYIILLVNAGWTAWRLILVLFSFLGLIGTLGFKAGLSREKGVGYEKVDLEEDEEMNQRNVYPGTSFSNQGSRFPLLRPSQDVEASPGMWDDGHATVRGLDEESNLPPQVGRASRISLSGGTTTQAGTTYPPTSTPMRSRPVSGAFKSRSSSPARDWRQRAEDRIREVLFECMPAQTLDYSLSRINQDQAGRDSRDLMGTPRPSNDQRHLNKVTEELNDSIPAAAPPIATRRVNAQTDSDAQAAAVARNRTHTGDTDVETVGDWNRSRRSRATSNPASPTLGQRMEKLQNQDKVASIDRKEALDSFGSPTQSSVVEMLLSTPVINNEGSPQGTDRAVFQSEPKVVSSTTAFNSSEGHKRQESGGSVASSRKALVYPFPSKSISSSPRLSGERSSSEGRFSSDRERKSSSFQRQSGESGSKRNSRILDPNSSGERLTPRGSKSHSREVSASSSAALTAHAEDDQPSNLQTLPLTTSETSSKRQRKNSQTGSEKPSSSLTSLASSLKNTITRSNKSSTDEKSAVSADLVPSQVTTTPVASTSSPMSNAEAKKAEERPTIAERRHQSNTGAVGSSQPDAMKLQGSDDWWKSFKGAFRSRSDSNPSPSGKQESVTPMQEISSTSRTSPTTPRRALARDSADLAGIELENNLSTDSLGNQQAQTFNLIPPSDSNLNRASLLSSLEPPSPGAVSVTSEANTESTDDSEERRLWATFPEQSRIHPPGRIVVDLEEKRAAREREREKEKERARSDTSASIGSSGAMSIAIPSRPSLSSSPDSSSPADFSGGALAPLSASNELSKSPSEGGLIPIKEESFSSSHGDSLSTRSSPSRNRF